MIEISQIERCFNCGKELVKGFVAGGGLGMAFYEGETKYGIRPSFRMIKKYSLDKTLFKFIGTEARACKSCKLVIFCY